MAPFILLLSLLTSVLVNAQSCPDQSAEVGPFRIRKMNFSGSLGCVIQTSTVSTAKDHRTFNFYKGGQIIVRSQIGSVMDKNSTGYRTYFILPAAETQEIDKNSTSVVVKDSAGLNWKFDRQGNVANENCKIKSESQLTWAKESTDGGKPGGFQIQSCPGSVIIDIGFRRSADPTLLKDKSATIRDPNGRSCNVKNSELFNYPNKSESAFKYKRSQDLYNFLSRQAACKELDLSSLIQGSGRQNTIQQR